MTVKQLVQLLDGKPKKSYLSKARLNKQEIPTRSPMLRRRERAVARNAWRLESQSNNPQLMPGQHPFGTSSKEQRAIRASEAFRAKLEQQNAQAGGKVRTDDHNIGRGTPPQFDPFYPASHLSGLPPQNGRVDYLGNPGNFGQVDPRQKRKAPGHQDRFLK